MGSIVEAIGSDSPTRPIVMSMSILFFRIEMQKRIHGQECTYLEYACIAHFPRNAEKSKEICGREMRGTQGAVKARFCSRAFTRECVVWRLYVFHIFRLQMHGKMR